MFTGIVEEVGEIYSIQQSQDICKLRIAAKRILQDTKIGDSIAVNGMCLTVVKIFSGFFEVDVMPVSSAKSTWSNWQRGQKVNLERAMKLQNRLDGHIVTGHIDGIGTIYSIQSNQNAVMMKIIIPETIFKFSIPQGSIAIDGISLTIAELEEHHCTVSIIPHTFSNTNLCSKKVQEQVNLETDIIGKYVYRFTNQEKKINKSFLSEHGFW